jgi:hypothetical protein
MVIYSDVFCKGKDQTKLEAFTQPWNLQQCIAYTIIPYSVICSERWRLEVNENYEQGTTSKLERRDAQLKYKRKMITTTGTI